MEFEPFAALAKAAFEAIPEKYRAGIDGLIVRTEAETHPDMPDIYTLGYCQTESFPSDWVGPETTRSTVLIFYGSFLAVAQEQEDFDWEAEIVETIEHEVRHHVESLAGRDGLEAVDYAVDEGFRRSRGEDFDPFYYQRGEDLGGGLFQVEDQFFLEVPWDPRVGENPGISDDPSVAGDVEFAWREGRFAIPRPPPEGDLHFVWVEGLDAGPGGLEVVMVRRRGAIQILRDLLRKRTPRVLVWEARARPVDEGDPGLGNRSKPKGS